MQVLIIAAGKGTRLRDLSFSKPLAPLLELPLLSQVMNRYRKAGINDFVIVGGWEGEKLQAFLKDYQQEHSRDSSPLNIKYLHMHNWEGGNGLSALRAKGEIKAPFLLGMCDHVLHPNLITGMINYKMAEDCQVALGIDYQIKNPHNDIDDATKVKCQNGLIDEIGKELSVYDAFDTGIFKCRAGFFTALKQSAEKGDESLSGGMRLLAIEKKAAIVDVTNNLWIDVDDNIAHEKAKCLINSGQL
ncbi:nucleotidyltransferase [Acetobacteraceae bacterium]|nr:nucleotidyltransferase [Acetobacteraceae bacterium]